MCVDKWTQCSHSANADYNPIPTHFFSSEGAILSSCWLRPFPQIANTKDDTKQVTIPVNKMRTDSLQVPYWT